MLTSPQPVLVGSQLPRLVSAPPSVSTAGAEATALAATAGLYLDPWQQLCLDVMCGEKVVTNAIGQRATRWAAMEFALLVARQNGKGGVLEARALAGLFLFGEREIIWTAHEFKTAKKAYKRMRRLIESSPALLGRVKRRGSRIVGFKQSNENTSIELDDGALLEFVARSSGSGRGFTGDLVIYDEAQELPSAGIDAMMPTISARSNPQIVYMGTVPTEQNNAEHWTKLRNRGRAGGDRFLAWVEFTPDPGRDKDGQQTDYESLLELLARTENVSAERLAQADREALDAALVASNPALGYRISEEGSELERTSMSPAGYARERLSIWPGGPTASWTLFEKSRWHGAGVDLHAGPFMDGRVVLAFETVEDRGFTSISAAGRHFSGATSIELVDHRPGPEWVVPRLVQMVADHDVRAIVLDPRSPAGSFLPDLEEALKAARLKVKIEAVSFGLFAASCGALFDSIMRDDPTTVHHDQADLTAAAEQARKRNVGEVWVFDRRGQDSTPIASASLARWGFLTIPDPVDDADFLVV